MAAINLAITTIIKSASMFLVTGISALRKMKNGGGKMVEPGGLEPPTF